jgi:hypothetical protein
MIANSISTGFPQKRRRIQRGAVCRWLVAALATATLAGCEHGNLSFDHSTGTFNLPIGAGSNEPGASLY